MQLINWIFRIVNLYPAERVTLRERTLKIYSLNNMNQVHGNSVYGKVNYFFQKANIPDFVSKWFFGKLEYTFSSNPSWTLKTQPSNSVPSLIWHIRREDTCGTLQNFDILFLKFQYLTIIIMHIALRIEINRFLKPLVHLGIVARTFR